MKEFAWRSWALQWKSEFADLEVLVSFSYLQCVKEDYFFFFMYWQSLVLQCEVSPDLRSFLNHFYGFFYKIPKDSCKHFLLSQKSMRFLFFFLILCHACDWVSKDLDKLESVQRMTTLPCIFIRCNPVTTVCWVVLHLYEFEIQSVLPGYDLIQLLQE